MLTMRFPDRNIPIEVGFVLEILHMLAFVQSVIERFRFSEIVSVT